jgi:triacylglycerol lipase
MNVVMVHGFWDTGRLFRPLWRHLEARGHLCHAPTLHPRDGGLGIEDLSGKLKAFIAGNVAHGAPVALVGFSMGAIVARHYLQALGGAASTRAFFSIAGPHGGTLGAYLHGGAGVRQMRPGSAFLRDLDSGAGALRGLPVYTYRTPFDLMVVPPGSSRIASATEQVVWCPLHSMLPGYPAVMAHMAGELAGLDAAAGIQPPPGANRAGARPE